MKDSIFTIAENAAIASGTYRLRLLGDVSEIQRPGQFINIKIDGFFLRRPIAVCDVDPQSVTVVYKVVGKGTDRLCRMKEGDSLSVLTGLGNGYDTADSGDHPVLLGGGVGSASLYLLAKRLREEGKQVSAILGFNTADEVFYASEFRALGAEVFVTTVDGSCGIKGFATDALPETYSFFFACGPEAMLRAVYRATCTGGQLSFERRMGCGFGACMGCSCQTITGSKRICREGPVMRKEEILWTDCV